MAGKSTRSTEQDLEMLEPDRIRNVVLVGSSQSGKTSLVEALLVAGGAVGRSGSVADGTTITDHDDAEHARGRSIGLAVAPVVHAGVKVNLIDTPGYADFVGELRAGLRAADCALFVIAAGEHIDEPTRQLWRECSQVGMPRAVVVTKLDHPRADFDGLLAAAQQAFGDRVLPVYLPDGDSLVGLISGGQDAPRRAELIEAVIEESEDETLMERYLAGEQIDDRVLIADLETAIAGAAFYPVIPACAATQLGCAELLGLCVRAFPPSSEHRPPEVFTPAGRTVDAPGSDPAGPLLAEVVKTSTDSYLGRVSLVRVFSGTLTADSAVHVSGHFSAFFPGIGDHGSATGHPDHDQDERIGVPGYPFGGQQVPAAAVAAGDIGAISRLTSAETGDTLSAVDAPMVLRPWTLPTPQLPIAIEAASASDDDKLPPALAQLAAEDPSLRVEQNAETGQLVLWVMGESQADVAVERLRSRFGVAVAQQEVIVPLRETFGGPSKGMGRHVKQSGGHGQYAICHIEVQPLPQGSGFEFVDKVVGGAVPRQFVGSVEKGVRAQMQRGVRNGYPVVDLRVTLTDGKAHSVDSSDMAFQMAGSLALREAAAAGEIVMEEPYDQVQVLVPEELVGVVLSDLSSRRGRVSGTDVTEDQRVRVRAVVPQIELVRYAVELRSQTHGAGTFTRSFAHYEPMNADRAHHVVPRRTVTS